MYEIATLNDTTLTESECEKRRNICRRRVYRFVFFGKSTTKINSKVKFHELQTAMVVVVAFFMSHWNVACGKLIPTKQQYNKIIIVYQLACESARNCIICIGLFKWNTLCWWQNIRAFFPLLQWRPINFLFSNWYFIYMEIRQQIAEIVLSDRLGELFFSKHFRFTHSENSWKIFYK